jgi:hypothetical protein
MRTFIKVLSIVALSIYAIVSFIRLDLDIRNWVIEGRMIYVFCCLVISVIVSAIIESEKQPIKR